MIGRPVGIDKQRLAQRPLALGELRLVGTRGTAEAAAEVFGQPAGGRGDEGVLGAGEDEGAVDDPGTAEQDRVGKLAGAVVRRFCVEGPPGDRGRFGRLVGPQRLDLLGGEGPVVDSGVVDSATEGDGGVAVDMPHADHGDPGRGEGDGLFDFVGRRIAGRCGRW